jgi:hypothetical protein
VKPISVQKIQSIQTTLDIAGKEIETLCRLAHCAKLTPIEVERHSLAAHSALNSFLNQIIAFLDPEEKKHKTAFRVKAFDETEDDFIKGITSEKFNIHQQTILRFAYEKSKSAKDYSLTYIRNAGNEERHSTLMKKLILSDNGWKIGKNNKYVLACWQGSSFEAIESDFNFLAEERRKEKPGLPKRDERRTGDGCVIVFQKGDAKDDFLAKLPWLPGALISNEGIMQLYGSSIHSLGSGSIFFSSKAMVTLENCKIVLPNGTFYGDISIKDGKLKAHPSDNSSKIFVSGKIRSFVDRNVFVSIENKEINLVGYLISGYRLCKDILAVFKNLSNVPQC